MSQFFIGEIRPFAFNFAPKGWAFCAGQILSIQQNTALFSLLGTTYGGNGVTTFQLPDLRGRAAVSSGQGPGLSPYTLGQVSGVETVTLIAGQMPQHVHALMASTDAANLALPTNNVLAAAPIYGSGTDTSLKPGAISNTGGSQPHPNRQPYLTVNFCIALVGIFPSRN